MVKLDDTTWLQWDWQIGTFRGEKDGIVYGLFTDEHPTAESLIAAMGVALTDEQLADLQAEKAE